MSIVLVCVFVLFVAAPVWHGWALREAFLAGISWARKQRRNKAKEVLAEWYDFDYDQIIAGFDEETATLDAEFTADELEAIACWVRGPFWNEEAP